MQMPNSYYIKRINQAIDFLEANFDKKVALEEVANAAMFSKYHFHRIFKAIMNETLNNYIKRLRLEKAFKVLIAGTNESITDLAYKFGYQSVAGFSRDFQEYYGMSPSKARKAKQSPINRGVDLSKDINLSFIEVKSVPTYHVFYQRVAVGYDISEIRKAFGRLYEYATTNDLLTSTSQVIGVGYDDPDFTPANKCRYDACIIFDSKNKLPQDIPFNKKVLLGGLYAIFCFEGNADEFHSAWDTIFKEWLLNSDYLPDDKPHLEMYLPSEHYENGIFKANLCLPIVKL